MKNAAGFLIIGLLLMTGSAQAELVWAQTPFWRTLYQNELTLTIQSQTKNLADVCSDYANTVSLPSQQSALDPSSVDMLRKMTDVMTDKQFNAIFTLDGTAQQSSIQKGLTDAAQSVQQNNASDTLPFFTLSPTEVNPLVSLNTQPVMVGGANSLTAISHRLGLQPLDVVVSPAGFSTKIQVFGKDSVCDLISGQAQLTFYAAGTIKISGDDQMKSISFYQGVEDITNTVLPLDFSSRAKAAMIGYKLGSIVDPLTQNVDKSASYIENLVDMLFDQNMERSQIWTSFAGEFHLSPTGTVNGAFHLTLEKAP